MRVSVPQDKQTSTRAVPRIARIEQDGFQTPRKTKKAKLDTSDWMFDRERFREIDLEYGPFTVDACSDNEGANSQCKKFYCPKESILRENSVA